MPRIRLLEVGGTPYQMGYQHGKAFQKAICKLAEERIRLSCDDTWTGRTLPREQVLQLATICLEEHYRYVPELMQELEGMADATGLGLAELIIANGFTDFTDVIYNAGEPLSSAPARVGNECTTFMVSGKTTSEGLGFLGQTWDMHETATPHVLLLRGHPKHEPAFLMFTLTGCVGMIGMNEAGISIGINNLLGADGQPGVTWPFVCRKVLAQTNLDDGLNALLSANLAGAHNYMLADSTGRGYSIEAMSTTLHIEELQDGSIVHANCCRAETTLAVQRPLDDDLHADSMSRTSRASQFLQRWPVTPDSLMELTRDRSDGAYSICSISEPPYYSETCGAVIMRPATREFWGVWGLPIENEYEYFRV